ncbi:ComEC/Rec2 family competence protein [Flavobacterium sp. UBA7682]|uniref:ComEC/Rec2 family competence protein n=1 Tax=Flavobacterium sp. UBA7682 TaxID=1946560 RepID=UPI0025C590AC|nr:hypothetical protein [Flavobacterium sp. UBA7682]
MEQKLLDRGYGFAVYPSVFIKDFVKNKKKETIEFKWVKHLLFGDWIGLIKDNNGNLQYQTINGKEYLKVRGRNQNGYILPQEIQFDRILEVNFIDVGQGDGCHIVTPDDKHFIIDAGESDNMYRFLKWRYNLKNKESKAPPFTVVISHSDKDHYYGFMKIFEMAGKTVNPQMEIEKIYHNGMIETSGTEASDLGTLKTHLSVDYITDLCDTQNDYLNRIVNCSGLYAGLLVNAKADKYGLRKGSPPIHSQGGLTIEVLGPVAVDINGKDALPVFGPQKRDEKGKTKNGHSVILKLKIGELKMLLGGDLNELSEDWIMSQYTGINITAQREIIDKKTSTPAQKEQAINLIESAVIQARNEFQVDIAKSCHHGSHDFTSEFLRAVNPIATIISSGDEEPHVHPRPDTLGTIGKHSRGDRSLIFSTELARSTVEFIKRSLNPSKPNLDPITGEEIKFTKERAVTVYGMINVRTDGKNVLIAQKLEANAPRGSWDIHKLVWDEALNEFKYLV